ASRAELGELSWRLRRRGGTFDRLVHSQREADAIRRKLGAPAEAILVEKKASEANVKRASEKGDLARARYVHFATHGVLGSGPGQEPGLVLSLVSNDGKEMGGGLNDGFLRLTEVTFLKLNADLVVLSACQTGGGTLSRGEGVGGLARAFLYAGSKGVVCSLWSVDDASTADLMEALYGHLRDGKPAAEALRQPPPR